MLGDTTDNTYGLDNSLLIYGKTVIVVFEGDSQYIAAFDAATGKQVWKTDRESSTWASPILIRTKEGKYQVVLPADPDVTAWDPATGKKIWSVEVLTGGPEYCVGPSPVYAADTVCVNCQNCGKEDQWLEMIGSDFVCKKCIQLHKLMGNVYRTHMDSFQRILKKLEIKDYEQYMNITKKDILSVANLGKILNLR